MKYETRICNNCRQETIHIEGVCIDCSFKGDSSLEKKLEEDAENLEKLILESKRRPK